MKKLLKILGIALAVLVLVIAGGVASIYAVTTPRFNKQRTSRAKAPVVRDAATPDTALIARGEHFVAAIGKCADCHGPNLAGAEFSNDFLFGTLNSANLTRGGIGSYYTDDDWATALRLGVAPGGRPLIFMPAQAFRHMSDDDLRSVIAYIRSLPAVQSGNVPPRRLGPLARALFLSGKLPLVPAEIIEKEGPIVTPNPTPGATKEYGAYLSLVGGCAGCHGDRLNGRHAEAPGTPVASNLTRGGPLGKWSEADFFKALREGKRPDGSDIHPFMPWKRTKLMTDDELRAVWLYLQSIPALPTSVE